jgi:hypothetical protein
MGAEALRKVKSTTQERRGGNVAGSIIQGGQRSRGKELKINFTLFT